MYVWDEKRQTTVVGVASLFQDQLDPFAMRPLEN